MLAVKIILFLALLQLSFKESLSYSIPTPDTIKRIGQIPRIQPINMSRAKREGLAKSFMELYLAYAELLKDKTFFSQSQIKTLHEKMRYLELILRNLMENKHENLNKLIDTSM